MIHLTTAAYILLLVGIFISETAIKNYQNLVLIPIIYFTYKAIKENKAKLPISTWFLIAFTGIAFLSLVVNIPYLDNPGKSFRRLKYLLVGIGNIFLLRYWLKEVSDKTKKVLLHIFLISVAISACYTILSYFYFPTDGRAHGFVYIMRYGYGTAMILILLLGALIHQDITKKWFDWRLGAIVFVLAFIGMYLSYTRGALLGFLCALPIVLYFYNKKAGFILGGVSLLGVLVLGSLYYFGSGQYGSRFFMNKDNGSDKLRRSLWMSGIIATKEKPFLGWGYNNLKSQVYRIKTENNLHDPDFISHSHNIFVEMAAGTGLIGLFAFMGWVIMWAYEMFKTKNFIRTLIIPFGVVFVISGQFEVTFDTNNTAMILFIYALSTSLTDQWMKSEQL